MKVTNFTQTNNNINFQAGKTKIYSDFDGTFMPNEYNHDVICNDETTLNKQDFQNYFGKFDSFLKKGKKNDKVSLTITTGRNLHEFNYFMTEIREKGLKIPIPDSLIINNGGDEYLKSKNNFFETNTKEMFEERKASQGKKRALKKYVINWNFKGIKKTIEKFVKNLSPKPKMIESKTHQGLYGYKDGLTLQENVEHMQAPDNTNYVSLRQDGSFQIKLATPKNSSHYEELKKLEGILSKEGYAFDFIAREEDGETFVNEAGKKDNWGHGPSIDIKPLTKGKIGVLNKFHHVKLKIDEIQEKHSDDLVITCGNGQNDLTMLNLSNYIDGMKSSEDFKKEEFRNEVKNLPLISIFVKNDDNNNEIYQYEKDYNFDGIKRFIIVDKNDSKRPHTLLEAIQIAQEEYSKINENYKRNKQCK